MKLNFKKALLFFVYSYTIVTILASGITALFISVYKLPSYIDLGLTMFDDPGFVMTVPYHLLINLVCWTFYGYIYLRKRMNDKFILKEAVYLGCFWLAVALPLDLVGWVLVKHPYSLTFHEFYIEYQPWISITYLIVLISPVISYGLLALKKSLINRPV